MIESKGALTSKINWLGILILVVTVLQDPVFADLFGSLFPAGMIDRLGYALGILVLYFRSNGEVNLPVDWKQPLKKALLALLFLPFLTAYANAGPVIGGGAGGGTGDMTEATYSTDGKIKTSKGGTGQDSSAWDGCYPSLDAGIWSCDDNDTRMQRLIGLVIGVDVLATNGDGSGLSGVVTAESDPAAGAVTGIVSSNGAGVFSAATYADVVGLWSTCTGYLKDDGTCDTPSGDNETLINRLIDTWGDAADIDGGTIDGTVIGGTTPAAGTFTSITGTSLNIGDGNATIDNHGAALFRSVSYIRDTENPFCQQYYAGTNYDDNYTEVCAPPTGYSETYRLYWPAASPTGDQVMVFPAPTLGVSQGTWQDLAGGGDLVSTNNLSDIDNATASRRNLGAEIGVDVQAYGANLDTWAGVTPGANVTTALAVAVGSAGAPVVNGGVLGTPSSGTLTNCSGLPLSGVTDSTSESLGTGTLEIGHESDTTLARGAAGQPTVEGFYLPRIAASGSVTHDHGSIASDNCTDAIDGGTATGTATTDTIAWNFSGDPTAITGFGHASTGSLFLYCYPTADHVNIKICNNTAGAIDPGEFTINWIVLRK